MALELSRNARILSDASAEDTLVAVGCSAGATTITVASIAALPAWVAGTQYRLLLTLGSDDDSQDEIVLVTNGATVALTVTRGLESTVAVAHAAGTLVYMVQSEGWRANNPGVLTTAGDIAYVTTGGDMARLPIGANGTFLKVTAGLPTYGAAGSGDVVGPASSVDNAIVRFDGTTGKLIQDYTSGAPTVSDTGGVTIPTTLTLGTSGTLQGGTNLIEQYNSTNAQKFRFGNTITTPSTAGEWFKMDWQTTANQFRMGAAKGSSSGTARVASWDYGGTEASPVAAMTVPITNGAITFGGQLVVGTHLNAFTLQLGYSASFGDGYQVFAASSTSAIVIGTNADIYLRSRGIGNSGWVLRNAGHLLVEDDNTYDIGASGATRPRSVYIGTSVVLSAANLVTDTTTGTKIGTATTQKLAFYNATPIVQGASVADASGGAIVDAEARTAINALISRIEATGLIATV